MGDLHPSRVAAILGNLPLAAAVCTPARILTLCLQARLHASDACAVHDRASGGLVLAPPEGMSHAALNVLQLRDFRLPPARSLTLCLPRPEVAKDGRKVARWPYRVTHTRYAKAAGITAKLRPSLTRLELRNLVASDPHACGVLGIDFPRLPALRVLVLAASEGGDAGGTVTEPVDRDWDGPLLHLPTSLETVEITGVTSRGCGVQTWAWLSRLRSLRRLCVCGRHVKLYRLDGVLAPLRHLEHLDLSHVDHRVPAHRPAAHVLYQQLTLLPITALVLRDTYAMHAPAADLVRAIAGLSRLRLLDLSGNACAHRGGGGLHPEGWAAFARHVSLLKHLRRLRMSDVDVAADVWPQVLSGLGHLSALRALQLSRCGLRDALWPLVLRMLCALRSLEDVDLSRNLFTFEPEQGAAVDAGGAACPPDGVKRMSWLNVITGNAGAAAARSPRAQHAQHVYTLHHLRRVDLSWQDQGGRRKDEERAARVLCAQLLMRAPRLELVRLAGTGIGADVTSLLKATPRVRVLDRDECEHVV